MIVTDTDRSPLEGHEWTNLCQGDWDDEVAEFAAAILQQSGRRLMLCGSRVSQAFSFSGAPFQRGRRGRADCLTVPPPGEWNDPETLALVRSFVEGY